MTKWRIVPALCLAAASCLGRSDRLVLKYTLDLEGFEQGIVSVRLEVPDSVRVTSLVGRRVMGLEQVSALSASGQPVSVHRSERKGAEIVTVKGWRWLDYRVRVGKKWEFQAIGRDMGRRFGFLNGDFGVMAGYNLFLLPQNYSEIGHIKAEFENVPANRQLITTLHRHEGGYYAPDPALPMELWPEQLHTSLTALGQFEVLSERVGEAQVTAYFDKNVKGDRGDIFGKLRENYSYLERKLGTGTPNHLTQYRFIFVPLCPDGSALELEPNRFGQAASVLNWTRSVWAQLNRNLVASLTRLRPVGFRFGPDDVWFSEGIAQYITLLLLNRQGQITIEKELRKAYDRYFTDPRVTFADLKKADISSHPFPHGDKVLLLTHLMDLQLQRAGRDLFDFLSEIRASGDVVDLSRRLPQAIGKEWQGLLQFVEDPSRIIPPNWLEVPMFVPGPLKEYVAAENMLQLPDLAGLDGVYHVAFTGLTRNYLENCGCKANQHGGVSRRKTAIDRLKAAIPSLLVIDVGDFFPNERNSPYLTPMSLRELDAHLAAMDLMGYDAVGLGTSEFLYSLELQREKLSGYSLPIVNCNVLDSSGRPVAVRFIETRIGGRKSRIIGVFEPEEPLEYLSRYEDAIYDLEIREPVEAVAAALTEHSDFEGFTVVIGNLKPETARRLVDHCPEVHLILTSKRHFIDYSNIPEKADEQRTLQLIKQDRSGFYKDTLIVHGVTDNYGINLISFFWGEEGIERPALHRISLSESFEEDAEVRALLDRLYNSLHAEEASKVQPLFAHEPLMEGNGYAGVESCQGCHQAEYLSWRYTSHAFAFKTLINSRRQLDSKCVVCHVTGFGYNPGFSTSKDERAFGGVQCETCHGPGQRHLNAPSSANIRKSPLATVCLECHTPEHSKRFIYDLRIQQVRHF